MMAIPLRQAQGRASEGCSGQAPTPFFCGSATERPHDELLDDEEDDEGDGGGEVYHAEGGEDAAEWGEDGLGDADEETHEGVGRVADDP